MMGPYYYYDGSFIDEAPADLHIHDCMWSGECYSCQQPRVAFANPPVGPVSNGTVPITVGGSGGYITLTSHQQAETSSRQRVAWIPSERQEESKPQSRERSPIAAMSPESSSDQQQSSSESPSPQQQRPVQGRPTKRECSSNARRNTSSVKINGVGFSSSSDNKKLRHREVEKNRHRQLQAMVKTLSEKIPGQLDKETQVQTMKRAARYCIYLRDANDLLASGQHVILKDKLEKIHLRSCSNVEVMMSQNTSN